MEYEDKIPKLLFMLSNFRKRGVEMHLQFVAHAYVGYSNDNNREIARTQYKDANGQDVRQMIELLLATENDTASKLVWINSDHLLFDYGYDLWDMSIEDIPQKVLDEIILKMLSGDIDYYDAKPFVK